MFNVNLKKFFIYLILIVIVFFLDRISKIYVISLFEENYSLDININDFINIVLVWNSGIGFGLLSFKDSLIYNFITILIIFINLVIIYFIINYQDIRSLFLSLILGGSLGNLFDRLNYSAVPDFIDINYKTFHWFIFNVADIFITLGVICLIFVELFLNKSDVKNKFKYEK